jgi:4'-phosphopantetheinyl transferase
VLCIVNALFDEVNELAFEFLHPYEQGFLETFSFQRRQHSYMLGRYAAKLAVAHYRGISSLNEICITTGVFGQPIVRDIPNTGVTISHSGNWAAAIAFPEEHTMGIDIECYPGQYESVINNSMSVTELPIADELKTLQNPIGDYIIWTAREAMSKILKSGLSIPLHILEVNTLNYDGKFYISSFTNLVQYKSVSLELSGNMLSIALPANTAISFAD